MKKTLRTLALMTLVAFLPGCAFPIVRSGPVQGSAGAVQGSAGAVIGPQGQYWPYDYSLYGGYGWHPPRSYGWAHRVYGYGGHYGR